MVETQLPSQILNLSACGFQIPVVGDYVIGELNLPGLRHLTAQSGDDLCLAKPGSMQAAETRLLVRRHDQNLIDHSGVAGFKQERDFQNDERFILVLLQKPSHLLAHLRMNDSIQLYPGCGVMKNPVGQFPSVQCSFGAQHLLSEFLHNTFQRRFSRGDRVARRLIRIQNGNAHLGKHLRNR